jgi:GDP-4-dehydro-6-deoxy-D-mannose reductase
VFRLAQSTVLVTGATGFVGGYLVEHLLQAGASVIGWHRPSTTRPLRQDVRWQPVDLLEPASVRGALADAGPAAVCHLAASAHVARSWEHTFETYETNVRATHVLLAALAELPRPPRVLVACSATIYKPQDHPLAEHDAIQPLSPYATSKLAQELLARHVWHEQGVPAIIARSFNHTGPGQDPSYVAPSLARQIARIEAGLQEPRLRMGNLSPRRDLTDVRDVVKAYAAMLERAAPGEPINVCSGRALVIRELVDTFIARARVQVSAYEDPALFRPTDPQMLVGDHRRLTAQTGWRPEIPLERTVDDLLNHWRARIRVDG